MDEIIVIEGKRINVTRLNKQIVKSLLPDILSDLLKQKKLSVSDLSDNAKIAQAMREYLENVEFSITADYTKTILDEAQRYLTKEQPELYFVHIAMFFEHTINRIIKVECQRQKISSENIKSILKSVGIREKFSWLLAILKLPKFNLKYLSIIDQVVNRRNAFIHYKWVPDSEDKAFNEKEKREMKKLIESSKLAIRYIKRYYSLHEHKKQKGVVHKAVISFMR